MKKCLIARVAMVLLSGGAVQAQTCKTASIAASAPNSRYTDNGDGTITDNTTRLIWMSCAEGQNWSSGGSAGFAGHTDWRVPNRKELHSLVEVQCYSPAINETLFPNTPSTYFWSSSPAARYTSDAWNVYFDYGYDGIDTKSTAHALRLVRGGN